MRFHFIEKLHDDVNVLLRPLALLDSSSLIERKVQEVSIRLIIQAEGAYSRLGLASTYSALELQQRSWLWFSRLL